MYSANICKTAHSTCSNNSVLPWMSSDGAKARRGWKRVLHIKKQQIEQKSKLSVEIRGNVHLKYLKPCLPWGSCKQIVYMKSHLALGHAKQSFYIQVLSEIVLSLVEQYKSIQSSDPSLLWAAFLFCLFAVYYFVRFTRRT